MPAGLSDNKRYAMVIDTRTCVGCSACVIGCKTENAVADGFARDWIVTHTSGTFPDLKMDIRSERCHHCEDAPCVTSCPTGASHYGPGGSVQVNADKCTGCKACIASCPYDARYFNAEKQSVDKCDFCYGSVLSAAKPHRERHADDGLPGGLPDGKHLLRRPERSEERGFRAAGPARQLHPAA